MDRIELKAAFTADETGMITGKAWDFSSPDRVGDAIEPGAFAGAIGKTIPMLFAHDQAQAVGVWDGIEVEADGLKVTGKLLVGEVARADEVRALIKAGGVTGLSIGFVTQKAAPRQGGGRTISALELLECSIVAIPAHPDARISQVKELPMSEQNTIDTKAVDALAARLDELETKLARPNVNRGATEEISAERKAFADYLRFGNNAAPETIKTLQVAVDTQGGYLAPSEMSTEMVRNLVEYSPIRSVASVRSTGSPSVTYPKRTAVTNAVWKGEITAQTASEPAFGQAEITVRELSTYVDISNQLLADSAGQAEAEVRLALAEDFGKKEGAAFLTGNGVIAPEGLLVNTDIQSVNSGSATTIADAGGQVNGLISLMYSLPAAWRNQGTWLMNGTTLASVRKLKDTTGQYIWQPAVVAGQPETILGRPVLEAVDMPNEGAGATPILFGDFSGYRIVDRLAMSILVNPYLLATQGITRIHATRRVGGQVLQAEKFRKLKCSV